MDTKNRHDLSTKVYFQKLSQLESDPDRFGQRRAAAIIECYELPVYIYRLTILLMTAMVALSILWATLTKVDVIAEAPGAIIPSGHVKLIQPALDGVLEKVLVVEGQQVKKGQLLVILASTSYPDTASLLEQLDHLSAERTDRLDSLKSRVSELNSKKSELVTQCKEKESELASSRLELEKQQSILSKTERQAKAYKAVYDAGGYSMVDYLQAEKTFEQGERDVIKAKANTINLTSQIEVLKSQLMQLESQIADEVLERQAQIKNVLFQMESVRMKLRETDSHFNQKGASADLMQSQYSHDQSEIKAPVDGTVTDIKTLGHGQVVSKGEQLMVIVPANCPLIVEAKLANKDIGFVCKGQKARLKLAAFPYQDYGVLSGTVTELERYPQEDEKHSSFYKVTIVPERDWIMVGGKKIRFSGGTAVTAEIIIRRKSVLSIILEPIKKSADIRWVG